MRWSVLFLALGTWPARGLVGDVELNKETTATQQRHHRRHWRRHRHRAHHSVPANRTSDAISPQIAKPHLLSTAAGISAEGPDSLHTVAALKRGVEGRDGREFVVAVHKSLEVNGPLPPDFAELFSRAVAEATHSDPERVKVVKTHTRAEGTVHLTFQAPVDVAKAVQEQAADPDSRLANGQLHDFLVAKDVPQEDLIPHVEPGPTDTAALPASRADLPMQRGLDVDTQLPFGELEPFGREDTAQELTEQSISESNEMVDQLERAEVAEEQRAVFRALTRLRGAAITAFDGIARVQTGNIDEYNKMHKWREAHPLQHLADEENDVSKWAFTDF
mmetsp:Transcript_5993/g.14279  ORF Transcript_5993/g.14279 Transcript_5993/m.14279 type:complete len:333 (-) Transcript_5993:187-1185(-)